ncbi:hypothetical protein C1I95_02855 [Micromonospora craterilacus]|uniref:Uncharacterized protein n=1 Tax=Micromonospora craterilacus TaxID=1655439 RepID=A0A2W2EH10_9ACTN|nr:hypothetical protein [Micromonospora craterilacus]PZG23576.1 hypothetical protein C1I95_02855 [Micromonospora craterilacus]
MTHDLPIPRQDDRSDGPSIVEWGTEEDESPAAGRLRRVLSGLGRDRRVPMLLAGLGAAAALASLLGEWSTMTIPNSGPEPGTPLELSSGVAEIGGLGTGYLVGLLALGCAVALAMWGTAAARTNARVAGMALAVGVLALLAATVSSLEDTAGRGMFYSSDIGFEVEHGRGLVMAFAAILLFAAALVRIGTEPAGSPAEPGGSPAESDEPRRRARRHAEDTERGEGRQPADITVTPTIPFAREVPPS